MNHLQRRSFGVWWKTELVVALAMVWGLANGQPVLVMASGAAIMWLLWLFRKDWKEARSHDDWY